jgi:NADP-reducing hydrogenase subunit HndC
MEALTLETLKTQSKASAPLKAYIKVGMDTGGIAAGADAVLEVLEKAVAEAGLDIPVMPTGSLGYSFVDPLVEVKTENGPKTVYGRIDAETAPLIVSEHLQKGRLLDDHVVASRHRSGDLGEGDSFAILVKDTSCDGGDKTQFFQASFEEDFKHEGLSEKVQVVRALDIGVYGEGLVVKLLPSGVTYANILTRDIAQIVDRSLKGGKVVENRLYTKKDPQSRVVLRNCGIINPESIEDYIQAGGYGGLAKALGGDPEKVLDTMKESGLRGRGGAGFPTWLKWKLTRDVKADQKYVICNGDEGDPGAFMDRSVLEGDPHSVLEGLMLAGYAIGASKGWFYIRAEYPLAVERIRIAIEQAREAGILGEKVLGTDFSFDAEIRLGAGAFVCGEETALIASIEGRRGSPEPRPPYPSVKGLWDKPTSINNVETLAAVPAILAKGSRWYSGVGTEKSKGTKVFAVTGKVKYPQLVEVPMGTSLKQIVFDVCGGVLDDTPIKGVQTGGPSGGVIPEAHLDTPVTYETLQELGSIMGSGGMLVMDENDCMVDVAKFYLKFCVDESCGKCAPCRVGGYQMLQLLELISNGKASLEDLFHIERICTAMQKASLCALGQTAPNPVLSTLRYFKNEYIAYIEGGPRYARQRKRQLAGKPERKAS